MKEALTRFIRVKSAVTLTLTAAFCGLAYRDVISGTEFMTIYTTVMAFYFGTQAGDRKEDGNGR